MSFQISRPYNLQCFLHENHVYTDLIQYQFEAQDGDEVKITAQVKPSHDVTNRAIKESSASGRNYDILASITARLTTVLKIS